MHKLVVSLAFLTAASVAVAHAQRPGPPPDHWLTMDSLVQELALTAEQQKMVADPYKKINAVMKEAAQKRRALREEMRTEPVSPDERFRALPEAFAVMQATIDEQYALIRQMLTEPQRAKLDSLPKPSVAMRAHLQTPRD